MATLTGNTVQSTYDSLIKIGDNTSGFTTLKQLSDGLGNLMPIEFSSTVVDFTTATTADFTGVNVLGLPASDTTYDLTSAQDVNDVNVNLVGSDATTDTVKLVAGTNITLTDNGSNQVTIDAAGGAAGVTSLELLTGDIDLVGTQNLTVTDNGTDTITLTGYNDAPVTQNTNDIAINGALITANTTNIATNQTNITNNTNNIASLAAGTNNVISVEGLDGALNIAGGTNIQVTNNGTDTITVAAALTGFVDTSGTPAANQVAYFTDSDTITGEAAFTYNSTTNELEVDLLKTDEIRVENEFRYTYPATFSYSGEIADFGAFPALPSLSRVYYLGTTYWLGADNTALGTTRGMLGLVVATSPAVVMLKGILFSTAYSGFTQGDTLYLGGSGNIVNAQPSGGDYSRILGYALGNSRIYFNPSDEYIETT